MLLLGWKCGKPGTSVVSSRSARLGTWKLGSIKTLRICGNEPMLNWIRISHDLLTPLVMQRINSQGNSGCDEGCWPAGLAGTVH